MTNTQTKAQRELDILVKSHPDPNNRPLIEPFIPELLALCEKFGQSGQSGGSAPYTAGAISQALKKLLLQEPICPITGIDDEWGDCGTMGKKHVFQNNRCGSVFKDGKDGRAYYGDAIVWRTQNGSTWSGSAILSDGTTIRSRQYIKSFPFTPKTFTIDVIEKEVKPGDWEFYIKDEKQLKEVFEYYDKYTY